VVAEFVADYRNGRTPNPCVSCNNFVKLGTLRRFADRIGARYVATGHYARLRHEPEGWRDFEVTFSNLLADPNVAGIVATYLQGISCPSAGFCEAGGGGLRSPDFITFAAQWNGTSWSSQVPSLSWRLGHP